MTREQILPTALIIIDVAVAAVYVFKPDWWRVIYWISAALLTTAVTFGMKG